MGAQGPVLGCIVWLTSRKILRCWTAGVMLFSLSMWTQMVEHHKGKGNAHTCFKRQSNFMWSTFLHVDAVISVSVGLLEFHSRHSIELQLLDVDLTKSCCQSFVRGVGMKIRFYDFVYTPTLGFYIEQNYRLLELRGLSSILPEAFRKNDPKGRQRFKF